MCVRLWPIMTATATELFLDRNKAESEQLNAHVEELLLRCLHRSSSPHPFQDIILIALLVVLAGALHAFLLLFHFFCLNLNAKENYE